MNTHLKTVKLTVRNAAAPQSLDTLSIRGTSAVFLPFSLFFVLSSRHGFLSDDWHTCGVEGRGWELQIGREVVEREIVMDKMRLEKKVDPSLRVMRGRD